jgi:hypothetical protein
LRTASHRSDPLLASWIGVSRQVDPAAGRGPVLQRHQTAIADHRTDDHSLEALERLDPALPLSPGRAERHGFEYHRHGTLPLRRAGCEVRSRTGKTAARHDFIGFLREVISSCPSGQAIHSLGESLSRRILAWALRDIRGGVASCA